MSISGNDLREKLGWKGPAVYGQNKKMGKIENPFVEPKTHHSPEPSPTGNGKIVLDEVLKDLTTRAETGKGKYGTYLRTGNGRDALVDAYQEACDLVMYLKQRLMEDDETKPYEAWDYCNSIMCDEIGNKEYCRENCKVYDFRQYLKENGQIIEED